MLATPIGAHAQLKAPERPAAKAPQLALDTWIVQHYRDAQLLADSSTPTARTLPALPRIESARAGVGPDTLVAVQFSSDRDIMPLPLASRVRLASPSGARSTVEADIIARRAFRAPRRPADGPVKAEEMRSGWAYLALIRGAAAASGFRGWLFSAWPDTVRTP